MLWDTWLEVAFFFQFWQVKRLYLSFFTASTRADVRVFWGRMVILIWGWICISHIRPWQVGWMTAGPVLLVKESVTGSVPAIQGSGSWGGSWSDLIKTCRRERLSQPLLDSLQSPKALMTFLLNTDIGKFLVHWPYKKLWLFGKLLFMETGSTFKHFNDVYYSNSTCPLPWLHTPKKS